MFFGVLISTLIVGLFEYQVPGKGIGDGRGDIWGFWIYSLLEDPINLIFGLIISSLNLIDFLFAYVIDE